MKSESVSFSTQVVRWQAVHGRSHLPWQQTREPYRVWLSEIMLQQTQVATVLDYYPRFIARFPDVAALAAAPQDDVLNLWAGLGYYSRARNLHPCAQAVMREHGGQFPRSAPVLAPLPGIGRTPAAAAPASCCDERAAVLGANVHRTAQHLLEFAVLGSALESVLKGKENPTVGLLNIGEEAIKGNDVIKKAGELLRQAGQSESASQTDRSVGPFHPDAASVRPTRLPQPKVRYARQLPTAHQRPAPTGVQVSAPVRAPIPVSLPVGPDPAPAKPPKPGRKNPAPGVRRRHPDRLPRFPAKPGSSTRLSSFPSHC